MPMFCDHENLRIVIVLEGECDVKRFSSVKHFSQQDAFFVNAHTVCSLSSEKGCVVEMTSIRLEALENTGPYYSSFNSVDSVSSLDQTKEIPLVYRDCAFLVNVLESSGVPGGKDSSEILLDKIVNALLTDYNSLNYENDRYRNVNEAGMERHYRVVRYIHEHMTDKLTLQSAAEAEEMQKNYFALLFRQMSGMTFLECVSRIRLMKAEELLLLDHCSNSDIIKRCGFSDSKYFYKYFQQEFGTTPVNWKNSWKVKDSYDCIELKGKEAENCVLSLYEELTSINTNTSFYEQYCLLKELEKNGTIRDNWKIEMNLYSPGNILRIDGSAVNTWYGFDLIMRYAKIHNLPVLLKINAEDIQEFGSDFTAQMEKSIARYDASLLHNWSFEIVLHRSSDVQNAERIMKWLAEKMPNTECRMTC